jgi:hypothetical protein
MALGFKARFIFDIVDIYAIIPLLSNEDGNGRQLKIEDGWRNKAGEYA